MRIPYSSLLRTSALVLLLPLAAAGQEKPALDHEVYDIWNRIQQQEISADGAWFHYRVAPGWGDATLHVERIDGSSSHLIERGENASLTRDGRFLVFGISPTREALDEAAEDRNTPTPPDSLGILELSTGEIRKLDRLDRFSVPDESSEWIVIQREAPDEDEAEEEAEEPEEPEEAEEAEEEGSGPRQGPGTDLHYLNLVTGEEHVFPYVTTWQIHEDGETLVFAVSTPNGASDGVFLVRPDQATPHPLLTGEGIYDRIALDEAGEQVAFLTTRDLWAATDPADEGEEDEDARALYLAPLDGASEARRVASAGGDAIPEGWRVSANDGPSFSEDGTRLFFGTAPAPLPEPDEDDEMLENVRVDIWSWHDDFLQPHQLNDLNSERNRTYGAVYHRDQDRIVQLEDPSLLSVSVGSRGNANLALGQDDVPYRQIVSWDTRFVDAYLVDPRTGERERIAAKLRSGASLSPDARYVYWWDGGDFEGTLERGWMVMDVETREVVNATEGVPHPVHNELDDRTAPPGSYGLAGWTEGDEALLVYDRHDIWRLDPRGEQAPVNLTQGFGRDNDLRLRLVRLDFDDPHVTVDEDVYLSAFSHGTKADGYYRSRLDAPRTPSELAFEDVSFGSFEKAEDADVLLFTKSTFEMYPDLWTADTGFGGQRRLTEANPQQDDYNWGTAELITWTSTDGEPLQGILYKPENFDPNEEWPMMVYFYERSSDGLHSHFVPGTGTSINRSFYVSRGYVLFVPDIPYKAGYPGESAMNAVMPGITSIVNQGFVDEGRIGVQGHSWGGYQITYMVTRTNLFAAAEAGAPVVNMTSAYGGIRWGTGRVRQMQYETGQSRIGGTLWDAQHRYIENSPLFTAYRVETPLLMLHNDEDTAVPWEQGIEFFVALRRLGKPTWLVNYNGQGHGVSGRHAQKDWTIRMQQFFDHLLIDAPPPVWMAEGVPALQKGYTLGLDLVEDATANGANSGGR
jgi:dipeptidyl aminopeptidase/acylaminoacyl peptidase